MARCQSEGKTQSYSSVTVYDIYKEASGDIDKIAICVRIEMVLEVDTSMVEHHHGFRGAQPSPKPRVISTATATATSTRRL
jgi:hypothetical protein